MDIRIGDIVRFISEKLGGKVTGIIDNATVNVFCDDYGFEIPASVNDLVVIHSDITRPAEANASVPKQTPFKTIPVESANTIYLAIVPDNFNNLPDSRYEFFIVNDTTQACLYTVAFYNGNNYNGISAGNCNPDSVCSLGLYSLKDIDTNIKTVHVQAIFFTKGQTLLKNAIETEIKVNTVNLCKVGAYKHCRWFTPVSILRSLNKEQITETEKIEEKQWQQSLKENKETQQTPVSYSQKQIVGNTIEVDLHCNELLETTTGMTSKDILEFQLNTFRKTLEEYKLRQGQKIIFIHGKGDGVLRQRILWELQTKYKRYHHQDASFKQYGYGATMVTIK